MATLAAAPAPRQNEAQIRTWFDQLADSDPAVRDKAMESLMGISSDDLPALRDVIAKSLPLKPSQQIVIRDIVTQIYITGMSYDSSDKPFLGLSWAPSDSDITDPNAKQDLDLIVSSRLRGFDAYRKLQEGDIILGAGPDAQHIAQANRDNFQDLVSGFRVGQTITLRIVRDGREMIVPLILRPRPNDLASNPPTNVIEAWKAERDHAADEYWTKNFAQLVGEDLS